MELFMEKVTELRPGHPLKVYYEEGEKIHDLLLEFQGLDIPNEFQVFFNLFNQLGEIERRFRRKENQLFPYLEKHGWHGPSQGMWSFHDTLREQIRNIRAKINERELEQLPSLMDFLIQGINRLMHIEDIRLFPTSYSLLTESDWKDMRSGDEEIGWALIDVPVPYPAKEDYIHPSQDKIARTLPFDTTGKFHYDEGFLSPEQVNWMLKFIPIDLTYVDENDKVIFYNRGEDRVFPRSAGIIGREVRFCHPPKSVGMVLKILEEFKKGTKDTAEFWINFKDRKIHIRYFAIRDEDKNYKGVLEMSQDITEIQQLEGQKRLLEWE